MDNILKILGVEKLDESQQVEIKEKIETLIEVKVAEKVEERIEAEKESLVEEFEEKFEDYKKDITSKFSNFVDSIIEEELVIPDKIYEYAKKGELYSDLIEQFKVRMAIDEGAIDEEAKELLREARDEIVSLRDELDQTIEENLEIQQDAKEMAANIYLRKKCDGLTEAHSSKIMSVLEGITDVETIDRKFNILVETISLKEVNKEENEDEMTCPECGKIVIGEDVDSCPECGKKMKKVTESNGKGKVEVESKLNEEVDDEDAFKKTLSTYVRVLRENKI